MNKPSDNFSRRRFLKGEMDEILNTTGLTTTFAQTNYGQAIKKRHPDDGSGTTPIIRL